MNIVQTISSREKGFEYLQGYDIALLRLKCYHEDVYEGVAANVHASDYNPKPPVFACKFSSAPGYEHIIALANEDGKVALQDTTVKNETEGPLEGTQAHNNAIFDIAWMPNELKLITASGDRTACLWDVNNSDIKSLQVFHGHTNSIKCAVFRHQDKAVFATGARDGAVMIWDIRANHNGQPRPDNIIYNAHEMKVPQVVKQRKTPSQTSKSLKCQSVTALAFQDDYTLLSCSAGDGLIKVWDLRKNYSIHKKEPIAKHIMNYGGKSNTYNGFTSLLVSPEGVTLYASCVDKKIYAYNISSYNPNPVAEYYGHGSDDKVLSFFVKACISPDGKYLVSGSNDETAYIWRTNSPGTPLIKLSGHRDEVTCIAWCGVGESKIVTCSDDCYHRIWRIRPETDDDDKNLNVFGYAERYQRLVNVSPSCLSVSSTPRSMSTDSCLSNSSTSKRPYSQISNTDLQSAEKLKSILSPIQESLESSPKRPCLENHSIIRPSPRRSSLDSRAARKLHFGVSSRQEKPIAVIESSPGKSSDCDSNDAMPSCSSERIPTTGLFSPTSGLPNFVIDGTAPHLANSPQKLKENVDWLTKIRKRKTAELKINSKLTEDSPSPKNHKTPTSRTKRSRSREIRKTPKSSPFFVPTITNFYHNINVDSANESS